MRRIASVIVLITSLFMGCSEDTIVTPSNELIVVRGYIYAGENIDDIQITKTLPLGSEETTAPPVNDATVTLIKEGVSYALVPDVGDSGYYHYKGDDLAVESGDEFEIQVVHNGNIASATTVVPAPPEDLTISADELVISEEFGPGSMPQDSMSILLQWKEDEASLFYVVVECLEEDPVDITTFGRPSGNNETGRRFVFPPTNNNEFMIGRFNLSYYGKHQAKVYRVNQEYADLYESRNQDSRDLNEPLTNVENGLGVFSAFASQFVYFNVVSD